MMRLLYTLGIRCYAAGVRVAALGGGKAAKMVEGWKRTFGRLSVAPVGKEKTAWFHASSLGEFEQARPVLEGFREMHPDYKICVTFFSPSGYEVRKDYDKADFVSYLPMDTPANAARFVNLLHPTVVFFAKYDFWFNYLEQLHRREIPTYIFSAIFRPNQYFFKWYGVWFLKHLQRSFTHLFVQNDESVALLQAHGVPQVTKAGDTRFDRVNAIAQGAKHFPEIEAFLSRHSGNKVLLAGSSWEPDEDNLKHYFDHAGEKLTLVIAPHVISDSHLEHIESLFAEYGCTRYSKIGEADSDSRILVIDNIGMLSSLYQYADVAYIGGGFGKGIHNILEAVTFGKPVVFGPNYHKFKEARDVIASGGGFSYVSYVQLQHHLDTLFNDPVTYDTASKVCRQYLDDNLGSTQLILAQVNEDLKKYVSA
ncbi:MAG: 3-deoxy-D-manno-octulosonic acid transferase [Bacteroidales bacterium]|nr:3-deoxy-D-manno-octulosonic acid transferase [Bacteroidales bacterium]